MTIMATIETFKCDYCGYKFEASKRKQIGLDFICWDCYKQSYEYMTHLNRVTGISDFYSRLKYVVDTKDTLVGLIKDLIETIYRGEEPTSDKDIETLKSTLKSLIDDSLLYRELYERLFWKTNE